MKDRFLIHVKSDGDDEKDEGWSKTFTDAGNAKYGEKPPHQMMRAHARHPSTTGGTGRE